MSVSALVAEAETVPANLTKTSLAHLLAERMNVPRPVAYKAVEGVFDICAKTVAMGGSVSVTNFGTLRSVDRSARRARNPQTGAPISVPPRKAIQFKPSPRLVECANSSDPSGMTIKKLSQGSFKN